MQQKYNAGFRRLLGVLVMLGFPFVLAVSIASAGDGPSIGYSLTPWFPSKNDGAKLSQVKINNGTIVTGVQAGRNFKVTVTFSVVNHPNCPGCIAQIVAGFSHQDPQECIFEGTPTTVQTGTESFRLRAPNTPGRYYLAFNRTLQFTCADALVNNPTPGPDQYFAVIDVY